MHSSSTKEFQMKYFLKFYMKSIIYTQMLFWNPNTFYIDNFILKNAKISLNLSKLLFEIDQHSYSIIFQYSDDASIFCVLYL